MNLVTNAIGDFFGALFGNFMMIVLLIVAIILLFKSVKIVPNKTTYVIERLGKYHRTLPAGMHIIIPFIDRIAHEVDLEQFQISVEANVKTVEDQFIVLPVTVFYRVIPSQSHDSVYEVDDPEAAINSLIQSEVKTTASGMTLKGIFDARESIKVAVEQTLAHEITSYGYEVRNVIIDNPKVPDDLQSAFNNVTIAQQKQRAATAEAEALLIKSIGEAKAEGESLIIKGKSYKQFRQDVAEGNAESIKTMVGDTNLSPESAMQLLAVIDANDAVRDAAGKGATVVVATGNASDSMLSLLPTRR